MSKKKVSKYVLATSALTLIAGILHITYVAAIHTEVPLEMAFFIAIGIAQIVWAVWFYSTKQFLRAYQAGLLINGAVVVVWLISRFYQAPFGGEAEAIGLLDTVLGIMEATAVVISAYCMVVLSKKKERRNVALQALIIPLLGGLLLFGGGRAAAQIFNIENEEHGHGETTAGTQAHTEATPHQAGDAHDEVVTPTNDPDHVDGDVHN